MAAMMSQKAQSSEQKASSENHVGYPIEELINCDNIPAATPKAIGEGKPINKNETDKTMLARTPKITFATIKPPALDTPILHT